MILILLSWCYIFFTATVFGIAFSKALKMQLFDVVITPVLGLFSITVFATVWAFFGPIAIAFHCILLMLSIIFWYNNKLTFTSILQSCLTQIKFFTPTVKILLAGSSLLVLAQSATLPFIIDNESYYIQTIKWLNEYGFVKGLANLHLFLGQTSGWHIAQSVYTFSFLYDRFNDLNGFCLLLGNFFAFQKLHSYFRTGNRLDLTFGLFPLSYVFLFHFVSAPSPDLAIYVVGFIMFSLFLQNENKKESFIIISILAVFAVFIKITAVVLMLLPLASLVKYFAVLKRPFVKVTAIGTLVFSLFVLKNSMLTGYPLFPLLCFRLDYLDYAVPNIIMDFFFSKSMLHSFYVPNGVFDGASLLDLVKLYFLHNGMTGYIGIASVLLLFISPIVIIKKQLPRSIWIIYFAFLLLTALLCSSSPQYRFYIYFTIFFLLLLMAFTTRKQVTVTRYYFLGLTLCACTVFIPMSYSQLTDNNLLRENNTFHLRNILIPEPNSKWKTEYKGGSVGNMHYHSPIDTSFFWVTANGQLPCINTTQLKYFQVGFFYIPQQRSIDLSDGFYSQKVSGDE
jgi:hypothetical protein